MAFAARMSDVLPAAKPTRAEPRAASPPKRASFLKNSRRGEIIIAVLRVFAHPLTPVKADLASPKQQTSLRRLVASPRHVHVSQGLTSQRTTLKCAAAS